MVDGGGAVKGKAKIRKRKEVFIFGNYRNYYGYRIDRNLEEDPRLAALKKEWFEGKDCLDIGCNQGLITIRIAIKFSCRSILGVDIDGGLVESANCNLRKMAKIEQANSTMLKASEAEVTSGTNSLHPGTTKSSNHEILNSSNNSSSSREDTLLGRVSFRKENFVESLHECLEIYDTVLCLSVTKWIHLNWGDDGLITLFANIWRSLRPGGMLLLEPQPWSSYKRKRSVSETAKDNFNDILLHPDIFQDILLDKVGFRSAEIVTESLSGSVAGFNRPIIAFYK